MNSSPSGLRVATQDGSMQKVVLAWLKKAGLVIYLQNGRIKTGTTNVSFIESVTLMRPQEIPIYVEKGYFHVAIANEDWIANWQSDVIVLHGIPVARATNQAVKIVLAVSKDSGYKSLVDLPIGSMIATEYVELASQYLRKNGREDIEVIRSWGGTEQKNALGATAIIELTETGSSLVANGLEIIDEIMISNTVLVANSEAYADPKLRSQIDWFVETIKGAILSEKYIFIQANVPKALVVKAAEIIGGMKSPTVNSLATSGWYELSSYIEKSRQHEVIFQLLQMEVKDICVTDSVSLVMGRE